MVLSTVLRGGPCGEDLGSVLDALLEKQTTLSSPPPRCMASIMSKPRTRADNLFLFEAESTPQTASISHGWRDTLKREMSRDANCRSESITRMVGEVFRDMESRCDEAERPLRDEQSRSRGLQEKLENSEATVTELESQLQFRRKDLEAMILKNDDLEEQVKISDARLRDLQTELDQTRQDSDQAKCDATVGARDQDLKYLGIMTRKDQDLEEQAQKLASSEARIADQDNEIAQLKAQSSEDAVIMGEKKTLIGDLNNAVGVADELAASRQNDIDRLAESENALNAIIEELAARFHEVSDRNDCLTSKLEFELQAAKNKTSELQQRYDTYVSGKDAESSRLEGIHRSAVQKWQMDLDEVRQSAVANQQQSATKVGDLKQEIKRMRKEFKEQDTILAKTQKRLGTIIAISVEMAKDQKSSTGTELTPSSHRQRESLFLKIDSPETHNELINSSFDSSTSTKSGRTPKRMRMHRTTQTPSKPSTKSARHSNATKASRRSSIRVRRSPLTELNLMHNHAHFTPPRHFTKEICMPHPNDADEEDQENGSIRGLDSDEDFFEGSDIITSTDHQQLSASRKKSKSDQDADTTMDESIQEVRFNGNA